MTIAFNSAMQQEYLHRIGGESLLLLADKAIYWPQHDALLIADAHFGKAAAYRALGQPVPQGTTGANLQRLNALIERYQPGQLIFLGDFLHAPKSHAPATLAALRQWRREHAQLDMLLIRGNHDVKAGDPPPDLAIRVVAEPYLMGSLALQHLPTPHATHHVLAGHVHPTFQLRGKGRQTLRLPCFYQKQALTLLPAFGDFTGGWNVDIDADSKLFVVDGHAIWPVAGR